MKIVWLQVSWSANGIFFIMFLTLKEQGWSRLEKNHIKRFSKVDGWTTLAGVTRNEDKRSQTKERDVKKHMFWHKMLIYYNNMYVLMYFTFEKRFMWFFSNRDHPCSFNVKNIIKKIPFADQLTWSHTIFMCTYSTVLSSNLFFEKNWE
jgi:hypothetical protein